ncbi:hypothetical protein GCM10009680_42990 [Streptomyces yatensis]|uniref:Uncharacterized protein n=1 Tax=Streptomyces yatensis TaxID=155177 RepID=A0ABN2I3U9_9ACTN
MVAHLKSDGHARFAGGGACPSHQFVQERAADAAMAVAGWSFMGAAEEAPSHDAAVDRSHPHRRRERAARAGDWAVHPYAARELVHLGDLRRRVAAAGELSGEGADAVCQVVQCLRGGRGADGGVDEQAQFVAQGGDGLPLASQAALGCGIGRGGGVALVHRVSLCAW